jgi:hypothetical protein
MGASRRFAARNEPRGQPPDGRPTILTDVNTPTKAKRDLGMVFQAERERRKLAPGVIDHIADRMIYIMEANSQSPDPQSNAVACKAAQNLLNIDRLDEKAEPTTTVQVNVPVVCRFEMDSQG